MQGRPIKAAIVGSGPSGCYAAQFLRKCWSDAEIVVFESLPVPYGLMRYGVAADHQGQKAIETQFSRVFERDGVHFVGNVTIGIDLPFEVLAAAFDVVILATGLRTDRRLDIETGESLSVLGAGELLRALNGWPEVDLPRRADGRLAALGKCIGVVGNGNVAMDVVRLLGKADFEGSDIDDARLAQLRAAGVTRIDVFGRSPISRAKFDVAMFREILALPNVNIIYSGVEDGEDCRALEALRTRAQMPAAPVTIGFHFCAVPVACRDHGHGAVLEIKQNRERRDFEIDSLITAVGFEPLPPADPACAGQWHGLHVYRVGWLHNGGRGTMAENRRNVKAVVDEISQAFADGRLVTGAPGLTALAGQLSGTHVDFEGWRRIDAYERRICPPRRVRRKLTEVAQMLAVARRYTIASGGSGMVMVSC